MSMKVVGENQMIKPLYITDRQFFKWTPGAIDCYNRGCNCEGCPIKRVMESHCWMKSSVMLLVREIGKPNE